MTLQFHELACSSFLCLSSSREFRSACSLIIRNLFASSLQYFNTEPGVTSKDREKEKNGDLIVLVIPGVRADNMRRVRDTKGSFYLLLPI